MNCWKCGTKIPQSEGKIGFRTICERCQTWQHACRNCRHYRMGLSNDCAVPNTDPIKDRESHNYCEEFIAVGIQVTTNKAHHARERFDKLFKD